jgi:biopolymer transport protein TolQ
MLLHNEEYLAVLSSSAAVAPLLGLFGTVWGLIHAFIRISETQVADIATIAPGIAEALITTLAGLLVAIPALVMFNYLHTKTRALEQQLITLADRITFIFQQLRER